MERTKVILSVDPTEKRDRSNRWVLTHPNGYAELVHEVPELNISSLAGMTCLLADAYSVDRVIIRGYGLGATVAEVLQARVPESARKWEIWTAYNGERKQYGTE